MALMLLILGCAVGLQGVSGIKNSDTIPDYLAFYGIPVEEHRVRTDDGYVLHMYRLRNEGAPAVLFQHGLLDSAWTWLANEPNLSPGIVAHKSGYDVWLANSRGNSFSREHETLNCFNKAFWDFSFADMGRYDVPANIEYVLEQSGQETLTYVGHSQGTSQFFVMMTTDLQERLKSKVNLFVALSPVAYVENNKAELLNILVDLKLTDLIASTWKYGFLVWEDVPAIGNFLCDATAGWLCEVAVGPICGVSADDTPAALTNFSAHFPFGTSTKAMNHYAQLVGSKKFRDYDYGLVGNLAKYGSATPPDFDLSKAEIPTALFVGGSDALAFPTDVNHAMEDLPKSTVVFQEIFEGFSHVTWQAGTSEAANLWLAKLLGLLEKYNPIRMTVV